MITLITGGPGTGKTAWLIAQLLEYLKTDPNRPLFVHGVRNLRGIAYETIYCRSQLCDICRSNDADIVARLNTAMPPKFVEDWMDWKETGALIIVDEVQRIWRPTNGSKDPHPSISGLETHRHYGLDFWLISQGPHLFHSFIRLLVGRHIHLVAKWSGRKQYEWPECKQDVQSRRDAVERPYKLPKHVFGMYDSAEVHTQQDKRRPISFYIGVASVLLFIVFVAYSVRHFSSKTKPTSKAAVSSAVQQPVSSSPTAKPEPSVPVVSTQAGPNPFDGYRWRLAASTVASESVNYRHKVSVFFIIKNDQEEIFINVSGLAGYGYNVKIIDACHVEVSYREQPPFPVYCKKELNNSAPASPPTTTARPGQNVLAKALN